MTNRAISISNWLWKKGPFIQIREVFYCVLGSFFLSFYFTEKSVLTRNM